MSRNVPTSSTPPWGIPCIPSAPQPTLPQTLQTHPYKKPRHVATAGVIVILPAIDIDVASTVATAFATVVVNAVTNAVVSAIATSIFYHHC